MDTILAPFSIGICELKANPNAIINAAEGMPVAVLKRNKPVAYLLPAEAWEAVCDRLVDIELKELAEGRLADSKMSVEVKLEEL